MDLDNIVYSTRAPNIGERILMQRVGHGDWEAIAQYIMVRTNLMPEVIMQLEEQETIEVLQKINEGIKTAGILHRLSKSLGL